MNKIDEYSPFIDIPAQTRNEAADFSTRNVLEEFNPFKDNEYEISPSDISDEYETEHDSVLGQEEEFTLSNAAENGDLISNEFDISPDKGVTDYLDISAVSDHLLKTGVFIPAGYRQSEKTDIVVYLHGLFDDGNRTNGIEYYWKNYSNIRDYFYQCARNGILIAPGLSSNPQNKDIVLNNPGGLDKFLYACLKALQQKSYIPANSNFDKIIIAAHSAGGKPLSIIVSDKGAFNEKIVECWGFDCLYADFWAKSLSSWAKGNKKFYHYWAWSCSPKHLDNCPRLIGEKIKGNPNVQNIAPDGKISHQQVIGNAWLNHILKRPWFESIKGGASPQKFDQVSLFDISKAVKLNSYYGENLGWNKYYNRIKDLLLPFSGLKDVSLGEEAFADAVFKWQQRQGFSKKDCDGIIGPGTWKKMQPYILTGAASTQTHTPASPSPGNEGFIFSKFSLSTEEIIILKKDDVNKYSEIKESPAVFLKEIVRNAGEDPGRWFDRFTQITFLGRSLKRDQYIQENFAIHLKTLEKKFAAEFGGPGADPSIAGDNLKLTHEGIAGSRLVSSTATYSYHMFGLAVDINYSGCPYIQSHESFNKFMGKVSKLVANIETKGIAWNISIPASPEKYLKLYDELSALNNYLKKYFSFLELDNEHNLNLSLSRCSHEPWKGLNISRTKEIIEKDLKDISKAWKGSRSNPENIFKNGFLDLSRDFVKGMVESGLDWGARYGDIMHFDMRTVQGAGSKIERAKNNYINGVKAKASKLYMQGKREYFLMPDEDEDNDYYSGNSESKNESYKYEDYLNSNIEPSFELYQDSFNSIENFIPDISKAVKLNSFYAEKLGWNKYYNRINDLLLPFSGSKNVSLGEEAFADAVFKWQQHQGFAEKDCDGIIGPNTWKMMSRILLNNPDAASAKDTALSDSAAEAFNSIEMPPKVYSLEKIPEGFKKTSYSGWQGLDRKSKIRVDEAAKKINAKGTLKNLGITEVDIDTFQRLSNAETGGSVQNFYSLDMAIVSMGFRQFTFIHGNIHDWINKTPSAFKRYGIEIDNSLPPYIIKRSNGNYTVKRIKGADDPETLRWNGWAQRFYYAGLDYDIITAEFLLAKEYFARELERLKSGLKNNLDQFTKFKSFYDLSGHLRAFFHELNNAAPSRVPGIALKAFQKVTSNEDPDQFLQIFFKTAEENWPKPDQVQRIFDHTSVGSKIKVFEDEYTYSEYYNINDENEADFDKTELLLPVYELFLNEPELLIQDPGRAVQLNRYYSEKLGWNQFYDQINNLLLPFSGQQNVSLGEEVFAHAVSGWQKQQGFPEKDCDGIIGPRTWDRMKSFINLNVSSDKPGGTTIPSDAPSVENIPTFNAWYAQKILYSMNAGIAGTNFHAKDQLANIAKGEAVLNVDPNKRIIQILPVIYHIVENARAENYKDIIIGSFIRKADDNGSCTGHCEGRCIDLNFKGGSFENPDSTRMVIKILQYLNTLPSQFKKNLGFGMPLQGEFFGHKNFKKYNKVDSSNLVNPELRDLVFHLGIVFPDNNNHLHIQIRWDTDSGKIKHEDLLAGLHDENEIVQYVQQENLVGNLFDNYTLAYRLDKVSDWLPLLIFKVDDDLAAKLKSRNMYVQYAHNESYSNDLNTDFYRLRIHKYPLLNGVQMNAQSLIKYIRININNLVDTDYCDFSPYDSVIDAPIWQSDNPKNAVLKLDIKGPDNASVVVSLAKPNGWRFTTIHTPATGAHPVSGNREFFIDQDSATGGTYFVIKGLDMMSTGVAGLGLPFFGGWGFKQGDALWRSMRSKIINLINSNGGEANEDITYSERVEWRFVYYRYKNLLESTFGKGAGSPESSPFFDLSEVPVMEINYQ